MAAEAISTANKSQTPQQNYSSTSSASTTSSSANSAMNSKDINASPTTTTPALTTATTSEEYLNKKINFIQNHINNLLVEITNLPEPWTYAVTEDGRVFFINESEKTTTWLHPKSGQPVSIMIIPPIEDLPTGCQKDHILGLPYIIDHNRKENFLTNALANSLLTAGTLNSTTVAETSLLPKFLHQNPADTATTAQQPNYSEVKMRSPSKNNFNSISAGKNYSNGHELPILRQMTNSAVDCAGDVGSSDPNMTSGSASTSSSMSTSNN
jgi:hypothetical protein